MWRGDGESAVEPPGIVNILGVQFPGHKLIDGAFYFFPYARLQGAIRSTPAAVFHSICNSFLILSTPGSVPVEF